MHACSTRCSLMSYRHILFDLISSRVSSHQKCVSSHHSFWSPLCDMRKACICRLYLLVLVYKDIFLKVFFDLIWYGKKPQKDHYMLKNTETGSILLMLWHAPRRTVIVKSGLLWADKSHTHLQTEPYSECLTPSYKCHSTSSYRLKSDSFWISV